MHTGRSYKLFEFLVWTRRNLYLLLVLGIVPVVLYRVAGLTWLAIPWTAIAFLGTATAFVVGFKNVQTYNRTWEARQVWGDIISNSRAWGSMARDYITNPGITRLLVYRHLAWLTAMRYQMREKRSWETIGKCHNDEYRRFYLIPEREAPLETELAKYLSQDDLKYVLEKRNRAAHIASLQSKTLKALFASQEIVVLQFTDMQRALKEFYLQQGRSERIKDFPFPRQFIIISSIFVKLFCFLLPFGLLSEFEKLDSVVSGPMQGNMIWMVVPVSVVISWMYMALEQVGESTENPFEGSANDVPISQMSRSVEIDLREMLGEAHLPLPQQPVNNIVL